MLCCDSLKCDNRVQLLCMLPQNPEQHPTHTGKVLAARCACPRVIDATLTTDKAGKLNSGVWSTCDREQASAHRTSCPYRARCDSPCCHRFNDSAQPCSPAYPPVKSHTATHAHKKCSCKHDGCLQPYPNKPVDPPTSRCTTHAGCWLCSCTPAASTQTCPTHAHP